jgi:hypothetical protein
MEKATPDIESLIEQTAALTWEDPSSQLESIPLGQGSSELLPLVGKVISQKIQNNQSVNAALSKSWFFAIPFSFAVLGPNLFLFKFSKQEQVSRILTNVWNVNGYLLSIQVWSPSATLGDLSLTMVPFWIQIHGLPLQNLTIKNAIAIGKALGSPIKVEDNSGVEGTFRSFLRTLVSIDVSKPLNPGFAFSKEDGSSSWVSLKYERLDIYCTDCGLIGHFQAACLAPKAERSPSRYIISLKVNIFSNLVPTSSVRNQPTTSASPSSLARKNLVQPFLGSTQPHANQTNILTSSQNPLTNQNSVLAGKTHAQDTPSHFSNPAARPETPIESTLNALSLFQKPVQLFSSPSTSLSNQTNSKLPLRVDPSQSIISLSCDTEPNPTEKTHTTATFTTKSSHVTTKPCPLNKQTRKSPRTTKHPMLAPIDMPSSFSPDSSIPTPPLMSRKRQNTTDLESNPKKGPGFAKELEDPPDSPPSSPTVFNIGSAGKAPARAIFKAARKGKKKLVSEVVSYDLGTTCKGGFVKPPQQQ